MEHSTDRNEMELLLHDLRHAGHYASYHHDIIFLNSMHSVRKLGGKFIVTDDDALTDKEFDTAFDALTYCNKVGDTTTMKAIRDGINQAVQGEQLTIFETEELS